MTEGITKDPYTALEEATGDPAYSSFRFWEAIAVEAYHRLFEECFPTGVVGLNTN